MRFVGVGDVVVAVGNGVARIVWHRGAGCDQGLGLGEPTDLVANGGTKAVQEGDDDDDDRRRQGRDHDGGAIEDGHDSSPGVMGGFACLIGGSVVSWEL